MTNPVPIINPEAMTQLQLALFKETAPLSKLRVNETYELLPKDVAPGNTDIVWVDLPDGSRLAKPLVVSFRYRSSDSPTLVTMKPASISKEDGTVESRFPGLMESRVEHILLWMAARQPLQAGELSSGKPKLSLLTSIYQIRKELILAVHRKKGMDSGKINIESCPYSKQQIKVALETLTGTQYQITSTEGDSEVTFSRLSLIARNGDNLYIELGSMHQKMIAEGDWRIMDSIELIASNSVYMVRLVKLLQMRFKFAQLKDNCYNIRTSHLKEMLGFPSSMPLKNIRYRIRCLLDESPLVSRYVEDNKFDKNKIVDSVFYIYPTVKFVQSVMEDNVLNKKSKRNHKATGEHPLLS